MKSLLFSLSFFLLTFTQIQASCGFQNLSQLDCCIRVVPSYEANATWYTIDYGDGNSVTGTFGSLPTSNVHTHCYATSGTYTVTLTYYNQFSAICGASSNVTINCPSDCTSYLCWEDYIGHFHTAESVTIQIGPNQFVTIPFFNTVDVSAGYNAILAELSAALSGYGITSPVNSSGPQKECNKGGYPLPGFFLTDPIKIISINGDGSTASALFNHENCP